MDFSSFLAVLLGLYYGLVELYISIKRYSSSSSSKGPSKDNGTFTVMWIVISFSMMLSIHCIRIGYGSKIIDNSTLQYVVLIPFGVILYTIGYFIRKQAIEQLGQWFTTTVRTDENQQLIDIGWYAKMRHPSYTGVLMCFLGISLLINNWFGLMSIMLPICSVFFYRIYVEERVLEKHFGRKYQEYRHKVPNMIIPNVF